jgi:ABC-type uncharacterized transport system permease subunit
MKVQFKLSIWQFWLLVSVFSLLLPVFMPSYPNPRNLLANVVGTVTITMFILSFPSSLFGLPVLLFAQIALDVNPDTIQGMYLNLFLLFVLGSVQWLWIVPRLLRNEPRLQILNLLGVKSEPLFSPVRFNGGVGFYDS